MFSAKYIFTILGVVALATGAYFIFSSTVRPLPMPPPLSGAVDSFIKDIAKDTATNSPIVKPASIPAPTAAPAPQPVAVKGDTRTMKKAIDECFKDKDFEKCLAAFVTPYLKTHTTLAALHEVDVAEQNDANIRASCHPIVHVIGRETFKIAGNIPDAFAACDQTCHSGCYHGAMERFLRGDSIYNTSADDRAHVSESEVKDKIAIACPSDQPVNLRFQCLHGLGHAIVFFLDYDLSKSLNYCDLLSGGWDRQSCWGGALMENITASDKSKRFVSATDYHFPCDVLDTHYQNDCYVMQTSRMLEMGLSWGGIIEECKKAGNYRIACMQSLGRDASNESRIKSADAGAVICEKTDGSDKEACIRGVAFALADNTWDGKYVMPFCESFQLDADKQYCYTISRGYMKTSLLRTDDFIDQNCATYTPKSTFCLVRN